MKIFPSSPPSYEDQEEEEEQNSASVGQKEDVTKPSLVQGAPFSVSVVPRSGGLPCSRAALGEAPWRRVSSPCCLHPSVTLNFRGPPFTSVFWGFSWASAFRDLLNGRKCLEGGSSLWMLWTPSGGASVGCPQAQEGLYLPSNMQALLFSFWRKTERHKNPKGFTSTSEINYRV